MRAIWDHRLMARIAPPSDWTPLRTDEDWKAHRGGLLVVHQRVPLGDEAPTKYHGRDCHWVQHKVFRAGPASGTDKAQWFRVLDAGSARRGGAVPCQHCDGQ
jgi:hypothetical protein